MIPTSLTKSRNCWRIRGNPWRSSEVFLFFPLPLMDALGAEAEGLAAEAFLLGDLTLVRSSIPNLEADLADLTDFPTPTQSKQDKFPY
ncbi:hypothetical protein HanHA300_Chr04g0146901 [Helianthus annuus]|nr:hypothetical protein HanHA300_Chr04g0146901 [Helianthus annuus]KAJ0597936.1 hypothetical protein HanHA89_Chr04g0160261 [Helianthus annuus]KAJ0758563.1 hypothetical protein HanLR1_Chr04g0151821 [Helianthus annuus]KAJ0762226.1 hypothetical protein HanOQP8_Chr04g0159021 [Helianthus annuus]